MLELRDGDVLRVDADAIVVPIDGTMVPREGTYERLLGNVGRQLHRTFPDAELLDALEGQIDLPLPLGRAAAMEIEGAPFRIVVVVSTLHHAQPLAEGAKAAVARTAFESALDCASRAGVKRLATTLLQGGWRLSPQAAFGAMLAALAQRDRTGIHLIVACLDPALARDLRGQARSLGLLHEGP